MRRAAIGAVAAGCLVVAAVVQASSTPAPSAPSSPSPTVSTSTFAGSPWSVVNEYYGDVESGDFPAAWQLLGFDPNGETYAQFVAGAPALSRPTRPPTRR